MPRGGRRSGTPGAQYGNRSDLQNGARPLPVSTMAGQQYGKATAQADAQKALPMAGTPLPPLPQGQPEAPPPLTPADVPSLSDPSTRPDEHVMSGAPVGPGPGPALPIPAQYATARDLLTGALSASPNPEVQYLLSQMQARGL
jgi:hypothetical protein